jgi:phage shock protein A
MMELSNRLADVAKGVNTMNAPLMIRDFIVAMDVTNSLLAQAVREDSRASAAVKQAESIAYFDRAPEFLKAKGVRESSDAKKMYIPMDDDYQEACDRKAKSEAMVSLLKNKMQEFRCAHDSVKKMAYSGDYHNSPME